MTVADMNVLWKEWLGLHAEVEANDKCLSAPFFSDLATDMAAKHKLLFVGKATNDWYKDHWDTMKVRGPSEKIIREVQAWNRKVLEEGGNGSHFWHTFDAVSAGLGGHGYSNAVWTNLAEIGQHRANPVGRLLASQADLAARTLKAEICFYQPSLVMFVSGTYADEIVLRATGTTRGDWKWSENNSDLAAIDRDVW